MKLKVFDRITNVILVLFVLALTGFCFAVAWGLLPAAILVNFTNWLRSGWIPAVVMSIVLVVMLVICIRILFVRQKRPVVQAAPQAPGVLVRNGDNGSVFMTVSAIEEMTLKFVRSDARVRECRCEVAVADNSVGICINANLVADANIPETTREIQDSLKEHLEGLTGIAVREIQIIIEQQAAAAPALK